MTVAEMIETPFLAGTAPPRAKPLSFFQQLRAANANPYETLHMAVFEQPVFQPKSLFGRQLWVNDPDGVRRVLLDNVANYPKTDMEKRFFSAMFGEGLLSSDGATWKTHRKVMAPSFDPRSVAAYAPAMAETAEAFRLHWDALANDPLVDVAEEMTALTLQIICRTMFSSDGDDLVEMTGRTLTATQAALKFSILDILPIVGPRRMDAREKAIHGDFAGMDAAIYRMIAEREANLAAAPKDLLTRLVAAKDPDNGAGLNAKEVRDEVITIFMAGHETTAVTMTWIWYLLSQHPSVEAKLHAELDAVLGGRTPTAEDVASLPYTRMVIEEAMRLYPPAPGVSTRVALKDDEICGSKVKAGTQVAISPWVLHRHRALWDHPERFDPERFNVQNSVGRPRFAYLPFGAGPRVCIGAVLAMTEATLILAVLAQRYQPRLADGETVTLQARITLRPKGGMKMRLEPRDGS
ncbi:MAG TPA: cytochrome P450 [Caulobacteraceae bacterium]|jgi:cytochrome P450|nr:cytochrome P450 [Caulobacteraceae bacterium]